MKKLLFILYFILFLALFINLNATESVTLALDESQSLQTCIDVLIDSKALNFGQFDPDDDSYFVRVSEATINLLGGSTNNVELSLTARAYADIKIFNGLFGFDLDRDLDIEIVGTLVLSPNSQGFEIKLNDADVECDDQDWPDWLPEYEEFIDSYIEDAIIGLPLITFSNVFPDVNLNYFASTTPTMVVTADEIRLFLEVPQTTVLANKAIGDPDYLSGTLSLYNHTTPAVNQLNKPSPTTVPVRLNETYHAKTHDEILSGKKHNRWTNNLDFKMETDQFEMTPLIKSNNVIAYFNDRSSVTLTSNVTGVPMQFRDPWLVVGGVQPDVFREITYGQYSVFLNQTSGDAPAVYTLKAPQIGQVTSSDIYVFDHWGAVNAEFNANHDTTTTSLETAVVFKSANATVTAHYVSANASGKVVSLENNLSLPAGAHYLIGSSFFRIDANNHQVLGNAANKACFEMESGQTCWDGIDDCAELRNVSIHNTTYVVSNIIDNSDLDNTAHVYAGALMNSHISDGIKGIENLNNSYLAIENTIIENCEDFGVYASSNDGQLVVNINKATIRGCDYGVQYISDANGGSTELLIDSSVITDCNVRNVNIKNIDASITRSLISDGEVGIYLYCYGIHPPMCVDITNTSIVNNKTGIKAYYYGSNLQDIVFQNSILALNDTSIQKINAPFAPAYSCFYNTSGLSWDGSNGNIAVNPLFSDPNNGNYGLQTNSPCIDAGNPDIQYNDPDGTRSDMGAFFCDYPPDTPTGFDGVWYSNHPKVLWNAVTDPDLKVYQVWKKKNSGLWFLKDTTSNLFYVDNSESKWTKPLISATIYYKVRAVDEGDNTSSFTSEESFKCNNTENDKIEIFPVLEIEPIPTEYALHPAFPNPFNSVTQIRFDVPSRSIVQIEIFDVLGRPVKTLANGEYAPGYFVFEWDGKNDLGQTMGTGIYLIKMRTREYQHLEKCTLIK